MKHNLWWNPRLGPASACIALIIIHYALLEVLSRFDVVSCIFSAGDHLPKWMVSSAAVFIIIRLVVFLVLPSFVSWRITTAILRRKTGGA